VTNSMKYYLILVVGGVLTAIGFLLGGWWWGTALLLIVLFLLCFWIEPKTLIFTGYAVFAIAWISGSLIEGALPTRWAIAPWMRFVMSAIPGLAIGALITAAFWIPALAASTKWFIPIFGAKNMPWDVALKVVASRAFETSQAFMIIEDARMLYESPSGRMSLQGGPGLLVVRPGNAVALERGGVLSQIVGSGNHRLGQFESPFKPHETKGIFDLHPQKVVETAKNVLTKDGIPLTIECRCVYQIEPADITRSRPDSHLQGGAATTKLLGKGNFPVYEATIRKAVEETPKDGGWKDLFPWGPINTLRDMVSGYASDEIRPLGPGYDPGADVIKAIEREVKERFDASWAGVHFKSFDILDIQVPEAVVERMQRLLTARVDNQLRIREAEAEREVMILRSEGRARSIEQLDRVKLASSARMASIVEELAKTLPKIDSEAVADGFLGLVRDLAQRIGQDESSAEHELKILREWLQGSVLEKPLHASPTPVFTQPVPRSALPAPASEAKGNEGAELD